MALRPSAHPTRRLIGRSGGVAVAAAALLLAAGCSVLNGSSGSTSGGSSAGAGNLETTSLTVAAQPFVDAAPLYIAQQKGYFKQAGLNVKIVPGPSATVIIPKVASGAVDIGEGNAVSVISADVKKVADFKFVGLASSGKPGAVQILALPSSGITNAQGLVGKTVGTNTLSDVLFVATAATLQANNVPLASVHFVVVPHPQIPQAIGSGQVQAGLLVEPYKTQTAKQFGAKPVVDVFSGPTNGLPYNSYFSTSKFVAAHPNTMKAFDEALAKGAADATANRKDVESILPTYTQVDATTAALISTPNFPTSVTAAQLQRDSDLMSEFGLLPGGPFNVSSMFWQQASISS